jgi:hypothetical protein
MPRETCLHAAVQDPSLSNDPPFKCYPFFIVSLSTEAFMECPGGCMLPVRQVCRTEGHDKRDILHAWFLLTQYSIRTFLVRILRIN